MRFVSKAACHRLCFLPWPLRPASHAVGRQTGWNTLPKMASSLDTLTAAALASSNSNVLQLWTHWQPVTLEALSASQIFGLVRNGSTQAYGKERKEGFLIGHHGQTIASSSICLELYSYLLSNIFWPSWHSYVLRRLLFVAQWCMEDGILSSCNYTHSVQAPSSVDVNDTVHRVMEGSKMLM